MPTLAQALKSSSIYEFSLVLICLALALALKSSSIYELSIGLYR